MRITRNLIRSLTPGTFQWFLLGSQRLVLLLLHESSLLLPRALTEPPELRRGRRRILVPLKTTMVERSSVQSQVPDGSARLESHADLQ